MHVRGKEVQIFIWASVLTTVFFGLFLRFFLAGHPLHFSTFPYLRHAHSHLGYFAVLFPLMWLTWRGLGAQAPGRKSQYVYALGVILSGVGFVRAGYNLEAIIGSALVGFVWVIWAVKNHWKLREKRDWVAPGVVGILLACVFIPPIAYFTRREPIFAGQLVQSFLSFLLLGAFVPAALGALRLAPIKWWHWVAGVVPGALFLGVLPTFPFSLGLVLVAWLIFLVVWQGWKDIPRDLALAWVLFGLGTAGVGTGLVANSHQMAVAGVHFAILGPLLLSFAHRFIPQALPLYLRLPYEISVLSMVSSIALMAYVSWSLLPFLAALSGLSIVVCILMMGFRWARLPSGS